MERVENLAMHIVRPLMIILLSTAWGASIALEMPPAATQLEDWGRVVAVVSAILAATLWLGRILQKMHADFMLVRVEHEILIDDYCNRLGLDKEKLPTRSRALNLRG